MFDAYRLRTLPVPGKALASLWLLAGLLVFLLTGVEAVLRVGWTSPGTVTAA